MHNDLRDAELMQTLASVLNNFDPNQAAKDDDLVMFQYRMIEFDKKEKKADPRRRQIVKKVNRQKRDAKLAEMNRKEEAKEKQDQDRKSRLANNAALDALFNQAAAENNQIKEDMKSRGVDTSKKTDKKDKKKKEKKDKDKEKKSKYTGWFSSKGNKSKVEMAEKMEEEMLRDDVKLEKKESEKQEVEKKETE